MDKYYTPELEDFYVGFEYERFIPKSNATEEECWEKIKMSVNFLSLDEIDDEIIKKEIRVKFLSKENIESLGFNVTEDNEEIELSLESKIYIGGASAGDDYKIIILYGLDNKEMWIYKKCNNGYEEDLFKGVIKNKSELIKLLKQLQIG